MSNEIKPLVSVCCLVYNHEPYLRDCFEGFVKQQTTFPFEILVHDDASTDHSADIIREYTAKYPHLFKPIYQTENQYSKGVRITNQYQYPRAQGKYIALCEGDDYWTDPHKLQMQVDWLETNPQYSMCCTNAFIRTPTRIFSGTRYWNDCDIPVIDMINGIRCFIQTSTFVFKRSLLNFYPEYCAKCHIGDYPLQIWAALNGKVRYFKKKTSVYRYCHSNSFTSSIYQKEINSFVKGTKSEFAMLQGLDSFSSYRYHKFFTKVATSFVLENAFFYAAAKQKKECTNEILSFFPEIFQSFSFSQKFDLFIATRFPFSVYRNKRIISQILEVILRPNSRNLLNFYQKIQETLK